MISLCRRAWNWLWWPGVGEADTARIDEEEAREHAKPLGSVTPVDASARREPK